MRTQQLSIVNIYFVLFAKRTFGNNYVFTARSPVGEQTGNSKLNNGEIQSNLTALLHTSRRLCKLLPSICWTVGRSVGGNKSANVTTTKRMAKV